MPHSLPLETIKEQLRKLLLENPAEALKSIMEQVPSQSEAYQTAATLLGSLNDTNKQRLRGTLSNEALQLAYNQIRANTLDLIESLTESSFDAQAEAPTTAATQGEILYRIPDTMPLEHETKCLVRIAMDEESIVEDILLDEHVTLKSLSRVSEVMQVELLDPSDRELFRIRTLSSAEQLVEKTGYTEWQFFVTPLKEGTYPLIIKVAVIELALGKERKKEIILEEAVQVLAEANQEPETAFKSTGERIQFGAESPSGSIQSPPVFTAEETRVPESLPSAGGGEYSPKKGPGWQRGAAMMLVFLLIGTGASWAIVPDEMSWLITRYIKDSPEALVAYAEKYPESRHTETAVYRYASLVQNTEAYRKYKETYPSGRYAQATSREMEKLEDRAFQNLKARPLKENVVAFLDTFPESNRLEGVKEIVDERPVLRQELSETVQKKIDLRDGITRKPPTREIKPAQTTEPTDSSLIDRPTLRDSIRRTSKTELIDWTRTQKIYTSKAYKEFIKKYPNSRFRPEAEKMIKVFDAPTY
ncbi:MAG: hypothetical protein R2792_09700 [Saprospiraceae bacterium]